MNQEVNGISRDLGTCNERSMRQRREQRPSHSSPSFHITGLLMTLALLLPLLPTHGEEIQNEQGFINMAFNDPDQFAWRIFAAVNQPAKTGSHVAIWETWAEQDAVYENPCKKPQWPGHDAPFSASRSSLVEEMKNRVANQQLIADAFNLLTGDENLQQVKLNRPFFNYVVDNDLWYQEGVIRKASTSGIDFPPEALVYKADWAKISPDQKSRYQWRLISRENYEDLVGSKSGSGGGNSDSKNVKKPPVKEAPVLLGLVAFHIVSKALDSWVWTTWNHADARGRCDYIGCKDDFGVTPSYIPPNIEMNQPYEPTVLTPAARRLLDEAGVDSVWHHYRLMGTQVTFTDHTGRANLLGNSVLEPEFGNTSSCMTCHSMATLSAAGSSLDFLKSTQPFEGFIGTPDPAWYFPTTSSSPATPIVYQTDFMWELTGTSSRAGSSCDPTS